MAVTTRRFRPNGSQESANPRASKRGVLIYWTVETSGAMAVHSQLISCSASEVHAMHKRLTLSTIDAQAAPAG
jgi:TnpA family transposase